jgi:RHS repeat-associated protein
MPGRHGSVSSYRYGAFGYESDDEVKGEKNSYTTEFRQYDPRIGRWLSMDPLNAIMPGHSPYSFSNNNPIYGSDPGGDICIPCMILNGLIDFGGQVVGQMVQGSSFSDAVGDVSWTSVGRSMLEVVSPGAAAKQLGKIINNPALKPYIDDMVGFASDAISEFIDDGNFDVEEYMKSILFGELVKSKAKVKPKYDTKNLKKAINRSNSLTKGNYPLNSINKCNFWKS